MRTRLVTLAGVAVLAVVLSGAAAKLPAVPTDAARTRKAWDPGL